MIPHQSPAPALPDLQVNASPSLSASDKADWALKTAMLEDMLDVLDLEATRDPGKAELRVGGFDLIWDGGPALRFDRPTSLPTMLGAYNERDKNQQVRTAGGGSLGLGGIVSWALGAWAPSGCFTSVHTHTPAHTHTHARTTTTDSARTRRRGRPARSPPSTRRFGARRTRYSCCVSSSLELGVALLWLLPNVMSSR
jgi:hypothetical protein